MPVQLSPLAQTLYDPAQREQAMTEAGVPSLAAKLANAMIPETGMPGSVGQWSFANKAAQAALPEGLDYFSQALKKHVPNFNPQRILDYIANHPRTVEVSQYSPVINQSGQRLSAMTTSPLTSPLRVMRPIAMDIDPTLSYWPMSIGHEVPHVAQGLAGRFHEAMPGVVPTSKGAQFYGATGARVEPELFAHLIDDWGYSRVANPRLFQQALEAWFR